MINGYFAIDWNNYKNMLGAYKKTCGTLLPLWLLRCRFRLRYWVCRHGRGKKSTYDRYCIFFFKYFITLAQLNIFLRRRHKVHE